MASRGLPHLKTSDESGQAVVEYIILLALVVGLVAGISLIFRGTIYRFWAVIGAEVSAPCPGCTPVDEGIQRMRSR